MIADCILKAFEKYSKEYKLSRPVVQALKHRLTLQKLKRKLGIITQSPYFTENQIRYITENYPKLEQQMLEDAVSLAKSAKTKVFKVESVYYLAFLEGIDNMEQPFDSDALKSVFDRINVARPYPSLAESASFLLYMRCALCQKICLFYLDGLKNKALTAREEKLHRLFLSFDEVLDFDVEDCISANPVEQVLMKDKIYRKATQYTKDSYRRNLAKYSEKQKITQLQYAEGLDNHKENFTGVLADKPFGGQVYVILHIFMTVLFTFFLCILSPLFVFSSVPIYRCVKLILDRYFARFALGNYTEPALKLDKVPEDCSVLVTVTSLITGKPSDGELFDRLEKMYFSCGEENVYFSLLCDLTDSKTRVNANDEEIKAFAVKKTLELRRKYGDIFFLFIRDRAYSKSEGCYMAHERKRGAVNSLCSFLCCKNDGFSNDSIKPDTAVCNKIKYVFTLDSDTNLAFDCVRKALGIMLHPNNTPVFDSEKSRVVKGYAILQPRMMPSAKAASRTFFTSFMCSSGGVDSYSSAGYDLTQALLGRGVFCGKGMFHKECFYKTLCTKGGFQKETVLSHDAPEGALLRCLSTRHVTLTDGFPKEQMSYDKRRHRWVRGDIQNLVFFGRHRKNEYGDIIRNNVDAYSKYLMFENVADGLLQIFSFVLLALSLSTRDGERIMLVTVALSPYILPFVHTLLSSLRKTFFYNVKRLFYSRRVYSVIWTQLFKMIWDIASVPQSALMCFDAVTRALFRLLISHKHTLEWTTAAQSDAESTDGILGYIKKNLFSALCGAFFLIVSDSAFTDLTALLWMAYPFIAYGTSRITEKSVKDIDDNEKDGLIQSLCDMWSYFEDTVSEKTNFLPVDNKSFYPCEKTAYMTSPTNIGLYLTSACVALRAGIISIGGLKKICTHTLDTLCKIPKYRGLLYNWYDVRSLEVLKPEFVSGVDVGNYAACLCVLMSTVKKCQDEDGDFDKIQNTLQKLIDEIDYSLLFNYRRKLFYIGFTVQDGKAVYTKNCYDMLMSETRILSYVALSRKKVPSEHFHALSRALVESSRFVGLASWSGTVFEYFMPAIFVPTVESSLTYEALKFALCINIKSGADWKGKNVFGISESCYNAFDDSGNYMYKAFGCEKLALCVFKEQKVISPYSSYLMLESSPEEVLENMKVLRDMGMYGKYGFYESCDFLRHKSDESFGIVKCFMSHHIGMSICSLGNYLFDGFVRTSFMRDGFSFGASELLEERIPSEVYIKKRARRYYSDLGEKVLRPRYKTEEKAENETVCESSIKKTNEKYKKPDIELKLCFSDGFDLCRAAESFEEYGVRYFIGEYKNRKYTVCKFRTKREGMTVITVKSDDILPSPVLTAYVKNADRVQTEGGSVVFYKDGIMGFVMGFAKDTSIFQGMCCVNNDENTGKISFDKAFGADNGREYVFAAGCTKSFDGMYIMRKRLLEKGDMLRSETRNFHKSIQICFDGRDEDEKKRVGRMSREEKYVYPKIGAAEDDVASCAQNGFCLMFTQSPLKKYVLDGLIRLIKLQKVKNKHDGFVVCACFVSYCRGLDENTLKSYLSHNTETFRLVLGYLLDEEAGEGFDENLKELYLFVLRGVEKVCRLSQDDAAGNIVSDRLAKLLKWE